MRVCVDRKGLHGSQIGRPVDFLDCIVELFDSRHVETAHDGHDTLADMRLEAGAPAVLPFAKERYAAVVEPDLFEFQFG